METQKSVAGKQEVRLSPLSYRFFSFLDGRWKGTHRRVPRPLGQSPKPLILRRPSRSRSRGAAHIQPVKVCWNLEQADVRLAFVHIGKQGGRFRRNHLNGEMQFLVHPDIENLAVLVSDLPVLAVAPADGLHSDLFTSNVRLVDARVVRIEGLQVFRRAAQPTTRHRPNLVLYVHLRFDHQDVHGFRGKVGNYRGFVALRRNVQAHVAFADKNLSIHFAQTTLRALRGSYLHIGSERGKLRDLCRGKRGQQTDSDSGDSREEFESHPAISLELCPPVYDRSLRFFAVRIEKTVGL